LDVGHSAVIPEFSLVTAAVNTELEIYPYTVNDPKKAEELVEFGVTGIITDDPGLIARRLWSDR
jgi:glycerophosphoryl diester phosphodiesterase